MNVSRVYYSIFKYSIPSKSLLLGTFYAHISGRVKGIPFPNLMKELEIIYLIVGLLFGSFVNILLIKNIASGGT